MDLVTLRKNLTSDFVSKEDRIIALQQLEILLRSTGTRKVIDNLTHGSHSSVSHVRPTSTSSFKDPARDSMASLLSGSGITYDDDKIPLGSPVSKFREARMGRTISERNAERALYAAVQPRPQRQAETIARLSSTRFVEPPVIPRRVSPQTQSRSIKHAIQSSEGTSGGDLLAFLAAQALDTDINDSAFMAAEASEKRAKEADKIEASSNVTPSASLIEYQTWTKKSSLPISPQHEIIKGSTSRQEQKRKPFTFHVERQKLESAVRRPTTASVPTSKPDFSFVNSRLHTLGALTQSHDLFNVDIRSMKKSRNTPVAPFTFHRNLSPQQDENTGLLDAPLLLRAKDWQEKLRPETAPSSAFDSMAFLQSSAVESSGLTTEEFLVPKGGGIPKRYKNIPSKIADHVRAMRRERFRNKTEIIPALDNVVVSVPPSRSSNDQAKAFEKDLLVEKQAEIKSNIDVTHNADETILNNTSISAAVPLLAPLEPAPLLVNTETSKPILSQNNAPVSVYRRRAAIAWTVGSDAVVEAAVAADLESHRIGRNRVVADLPMMDVRLVINGERHTFARAQPTCSFTPSKLSTTTSSAKHPPPPPPPYSLPRQEMKYHSYREAEKAADNDAEAFHLTDEQKARRLIDLCVGDNSVLNNHLTEYIGDNSSHVIGTEPRFSAEPVTSHQPLAEALMVVESVRNANDSIPRIEDVIQPIDVQPTVQPAEQPTETDINVALSEKNGSVEDDFQEVLSELNVSVENDVQEATSLGVTEPTSSGGEIESMSLADQNIS